MVAVRYNPAPGLPAVGKVPLHGFVSPPSFGINSTHSYPRMQKEHPAAQPLSSAESWWQQSGCKWCSMVRPRLFLLDHTWLPTVSMASEGPWTGKSTPAATMQLGRSRSWYQIALKNLFKAQSSLEPCSTPFQARGPLLATGLDSGCKAKSQLYGYDVRMFLSSPAAHSTLSRKGSLAGVWAVADAPPLPACIE